MVSDIQVRRSVLEELTWDSRFDASGIEVAVSNGTVTLSGTVNTYPDFEHVRHAVRQVRGVTSIADELCLRQTADSSIQEDQELYQRVHRLLTDNACLDTTVVKVSVDHGQVQLTGTVRDHHQGCYLENQIAQLKGVCHIDNRLAFYAADLPSNVAEQIQAALARMALLDGHQIEVSVRGNEVTLSGKVMAFHERSLAVSAAWHAPGICRVLDRLSVWSTGSTGQ